MKIKYDILLQIEYQHIRDGFTYFVTLHRSEKLTGLELEQFERKYGHVKEQHIIKVPMGRV